MTSPTQARGAGTKALLWGFRIHLGGRDVATTKLDQNKRKQIHILHKLNSDVINGFYFGIIFWALGAFLIWFIILILIWHYGIYYSTIPNSSFIIFLLFAYMSCPLFWSGFYRYRYRNYYKKIAAISNTKRMNPIYSILLAVIFIALGILFPYLI